MFSLLMRRRFRYWMSHGVAFPRSDSVVVGVSTFGPVVSRLLRDICQLGNSLQILQAESYGHQEAERRSMLHSEGLTA